MSDQRDVLDVDVLFVGGGPAGLAGALRLTQLIEAHNQKAAAGGGARAGWWMLSYLMKAPSHNWSKRFDAAAMNCAPE